MKHTRRTGISTRPVEVAPPALRPRLNIVQATLIADVSRRSLYYWMEHGLLPFERTGATRYVQLADIYAAQATAQRNRQIRCSAMNARRTSRPLEAACC